MFIFCSMGWVRLARLWVGQDELVTSPRKQVTRRRGDEVTRWRGDEVDCEATGDPVCRGALSTARLFRLNVRPPARGRLRRAGAAIHFLHVASSARCGWWWFLTLGRMGWGKRKGSGRVSVFCQGWLMYYLLGYEQTEFNSKRIFRTF